MRQLVEQLTPFATFYLRKLQKTPRNPSHTSLDALLLAPRATFSDCIFCHNSVIQWSPRGFFEHLLANVRDLILGYFIIFLHIITSCFNYFFKNVIGNTPFFSRSPIFCFYYPFKIFLPLIGILTCIIFGKFINDDWTLTSLADRFTVCFFIFVLLTFNIFVHLDLSSMHFAFRYFLIFINSLCPTSCLS